MRFMSYLFGNSITPHYGIVLTEELLIDLEALLTNEFINDVGMCPADAEDLVRSVFRCRGGYVIERVQLFKPTIDKALKRVSKLSLGELLKEGLVRSLGEVKFLPPVPDPAKIIGIGLNYDEYRVMLGYFKPDVPLFFSKPVNTLIGHKDYIIIPRGGKWPGTSSRILFHEYEFAAVIGKKMRNVDRSRVYDHVFGFTLFGDITAHDIEIIQPGHVIYQQRSKSFDTFSPMGPWIVTMDEIKEKGIDVNNLRILRRRNGVVEGESRTSNMTFKPDEILEFLSEVMTLEPGDVVSFGSPPAGPPEGLQPGDVIEEEVEGIGTLTNFVK
ncbi:MAG: fumarylacetoacetate hydrolase family protein [Sulfolobales archaeon]|nr:fumarylacetoacetate hydrolase family protein [Sulfolobales archaeon]